MNHLPKTVEIGIKETIRLCAFVNPSKKINERRKLKTQNITL